MDSSWEERLAKYLDSQNIQWTRPAPIHVTMDKVRRYFPDFYLPKYDVYLDPKNKHAEKVQKEKLIEVKKIVTLYYGTVEYLIDIVQSLEA